MNNIKELIIKTMLTLITVMLMLSVIDLLAITFSVRPQTIAVYLGIGALATVVGLGFYERIVLRKEDPLPEYILKELEQTKGEVNILREYIAEQGDISSEEVRMRAKAREEYVHREKQERIARQEKKTSQISKEKNHNKQKG